MHEVKATARFVDGHIVFPREENAPENAGAVAEFYGIIRADTINGLRVKAIEYTAYRPHADDIMYALALTQMQRYNLLSCTIIHSLGIVDAGLSSLFIRCTSAHRKEALDGLCDLVERVKAELPVWGKEHFEGGGYQWKKNKYLHE